MTNLVYFPSRRKSREQACFWLARIDAGLSSQDRDALQAWLAEDPGHLRTLLALGRLWDEMDVLSELSELFPLEHYRPQHGYRYRALLAAAAGLAVLALVGWLASTQVGPDPDSAPVAAATQHSYETAVGDQSSVRLDDGTVVILNTNTLIDVEYSAAERLVYLRRGEAHFDVVSDPTRPFSVHAGNRVVRAVGTVFNVRLGLHSDVEVTVVEGAVRIMVAPPVLGSDYATNELNLRNIERTVNAGEIAIVDEGMSAVRRLDPAAMDAHLAWQHGMLIFEGEPLEAVLQEVGRYTTVDFVLTDPGLRNIRVGGYFAAGDVDALLVALRENFQITAQRSNERILLGRE